MILRYLYNILENTHYKTKQYNLVELHIFYEMKFLKIGITSAVSLIVRMYQTKKSSLVSGNQPSEIFFITNLPA